MIKQLPFEYWCMVNGSIFGCHSISEPVLNGHSSLEKSDCERLFNNRPSLFKMASTFQKLVRELKWYPVLRW
jgi:hypothetical protein